MTDLIVMRLADMARVHPKQIEATCALCGAAVGVYPSGQKVMRDFSDVRLVCQVCRGPEAAGLPLAPGAEIEPLESVKRKP